VYVNGIAWIYPLDISIPVITSHLHSLPVTCYYSCLLFPLIIISHANHFLLILHHSFCMPSGVCAPLVGLRSDNPGLACPGIGANVQRSFWWSFGLDLGACGTFGGLRRRRSDSGVTTTYRSSTSACEESTQLFDCFVSIHVPRDVIL
jgi:hypothetical protein